MTDSVERFTKTVEYYAKYRPSYPAEVIQLLREECGMNAASILADIGSGTGLLTKLLLDCGNTVYAVEPNDGMRHYAERWLANYHNFMSVKGTAEATTLLSNHIDIITVGTAFHWFDQVATKKEFQRILRRLGWVVIVFNVRDIEGSPLVKDYEDILLNFTKDYRHTTAETFDKSVSESFFSPNEMLVRTFRNAQTFDWVGFQGRLLSTSYCLPANDPNYPRMMQQLKVVFDRHQHNGIVTFRYLTKLYLGRLGLY